MKNPGGSKRSGSRRRRAGRIEGPLGAVNASGVKGLGMSAVSIIGEEVARFDALGDDWWDPSGPMAPLHKINPVRIAWLRDTIAAHFRRTPQGDEGPLEGLSLLDIGCGAGLLAEPLSRLGADVTGLDPAASLIEIARAHAEATGAELTYVAGAVEDLARKHKKFDVVLAMEVVETCGQPAQSRHPEHAQRGAAEIRFAGTFCGNLDSRRWNIHGARR